MLELANFIQKDLVVELKATDKDSVLIELMATVREASVVADPDGFLELIRERESKSSTGIGLGIALPHARLAGLDELVVAVGRSRRGVDFDAPDGAPVHLIFLVAATSDQRQYLQLVARISWLVRNDTLRSRCIQAPSVSALHELLNEY